MLTVVQFCYSERNTVADSYVAAGARTRTLVVSAPLQF